MATSGINRISIWTWTSNHKLVLKDNCGFYSRSSNQGIVYEFAKGIQKPLQATGGAYYTVRCPGVLKTFGNFNRCIWKGDTPVLNPGFITQVDK